MLKNILIAVLLCANFSAFGQIKVPDVGDGWKSKVNEAIELIRKIDTAKYNILIKTCDDIEYWNGSFSTTDTRSIIIPTSELRYGNINNIAAILIHESMHLYTKQNGFCFESPNDEEWYCYIYELDFLLQIPNVEDWLIENARKQIIKYSK